MTIFDIKIFLRLTAMGKGDEYVLFQKILMLLCIIYVLYYVV